MEGVMKRPFLAIPLLLVLTIVAVVIAAGDAASTQTAQAEIVANPVPRAYFPLVRKERVGDTLDMADFIKGNGTLYEVWLWSAQQNQEYQARHQTQFAPPRFYHTKGNEFHAEWEELWMDQNYVYRGTDTSPGNGQYYTLREGGFYGSKWSPRYWKVGDVFERNPQVTFYKKSDCEVLYDYPFRSWLKLVAYYPEYTFSDPVKLDQITVHEVIELAWLLEKNGQPEERYFYARDLGLVGWTNGSGSFSRVSEIHPSGARDPNKAEVIGCMDKGFRPVPDAPIWPERPLDRQYWPK